MWVQTVYRPLPVQRLSRTCRGNTTGLPSCSASCIFRERNESTSRDWGYIVCLYLQTPEQELDCPSLGCGTWRFCLCTRWGPSAAKEQERDGRWRSDRSGWRSLGGEKTVSWPKQRSTTCWLMSVVSSVYRWTYCWRPLHRERWGLRPHLLQTAHNKYLGSSEENEKLMQVL